MAYGGKDIETEAMAGYNPLEFKKEPGMLQTQTPGKIFADALALYEDALEMLAQHKIRNAAEKAWGATKRATDALILARTGALPETTAMTTRVLMELADNFPDIETLVGRYFTRISYLHGSCFYDGLCDPISQTVRRIRETIDFIQDAQSLTRAQ